LTTELSPPTFAADFISRVFRKSPDIHAEHADKFLANG